MDQAELSVSLFRQVQRPPCQCHHVFITEGNPAAEPRFPYVFSSCTVGTLVSSDCPAHPRDWRHVFAARLGLHVVHRLHPDPFLVESDGLCRVVMGDILPDITGWQLCHCCYISVSDGRAGALRCPDHVSDAMATKTEPD